MFSPIDLSFRVSRIGRCWHWLVSALAVFAIVAANLPLFPRLVLVCWPICWCLYQQKWACKLPVERLWWQLQKGQMRVLQQGCWLDVERIESVMLTRWVIFMRLHVRQRYLPIAWVLWADSLDADDFRRMCVAVRFGRPPQVAADS